MGPTFLEIQTYRIAGHSRGDTNAYRDKTEEKHWLSRDPITIMENYLSELFALEEDFIVETKKEAEDIVEDAANFALASPEPDIEVVSSYIFR